MGSALWEEEMKVSEPYHRQPPRVPGAASAPPLPLPGGGGGRQPL